jgi:plastocyanin
MRKLTITILVAAAALVPVVGSSARSRARRSATIATATVDARATVKVSSFKFEPKVLTVAPGTTVEWVNEGGRHSIVADNGSFNSETLKQGDKFEHKFDKAGTYAYHCEFHGEKGGKDMAGTIVVRGK